MGLDTVELIMAVEEEFGLEISDDEGAKMERVGDMLHFVLYKLRERGEVIEDEVIWSRLKTLIVEQLGVKPEHVVPTARFIPDLSTHG